MLISKGVDNFSDSRVDSTPPIHNLQKEIKMGVKFPCGFDGRNRNREIGEKITIRGKRSRVPGEVKATKKP